MSSNLVHLSEEEEEEEYEEDTGLIYIGMYRDICSLHLTHQMLGETGARTENPRREGENVQTQHRKALEN